MNPKIFRYVASGATFILLVYVIFTHRGGLAQLKLLNPSQMIVAVTLAGMALVINSCVWFFILKVTTERDISFNRTTKILLVANLVRFIPGGIWQYPSKALMLARVGIKIEDFTKVMLVEAIFSIIAGILLSLITLIYTPISSVFFLWIVGLLMLSILCFFIWRARFTGGAHLTRFRWIKRILDIGKSVILTARAKGVILLTLSLLTFLMPALTLYYITNTLLNLPLIIGPFILGIYAFSWVIGFVSILTPSGLGVMEGLLVLYLSRFTTFPSALGIALLFRIVMLTGEALSSGLLILILYLRAKFDKSS